MAIEKYFEKFDGPVAVFDPIPSFQGEWDISYDNLVKNAKVENGKNLFEEFMRKNYDEPLYAILQTKYFKNFPVAINSLANSDNHGRCLFFSDIHFYLGYLVFLNYEIDKMHQTVEEHKAQLQEIYHYLML